MASSTEVYLNTMPDAASRACPRGTSASTEGLMGATPVRRCRPSANGTQHASLRHLVNFAVRRALLSEPCGPQFLGAAGCGAIPRAVSQAEGAPGATNDTFSRAARPVSRTVETAPDHEASGSARPMCMLQILGQRASQHDAPPPQRRDAPDAPASAFGREAVGSAVGRSRAGAYRVLMALV